MLLLFILMLFFFNYISFYIYNVTTVDNKLTEEIAEEMRSKNLFLRLLFLDNSFSYSNKIFWLCNFINTSIVFGGLVFFVINLFLQNEYAENFVGTIVIINLVLTGVFALILKLIERIKH